MNLFNQKIKLAPALFGGLLLILLAVVGSSFLKVKTEVPIVSNNDGVAINTTENTTQEVVDSEILNETQTQGIDLGDKPLGEYLDAIPNDSLRWVGVRDGKTIAVDIHGNEEILDRDLDEIQMLPQRYIQRTISSEDYEVARQLKRPRLSVLMSPYAEEVGVSFWYRDNSIAWEIKHVDLVKDSEVTILTIEELEQKDSGIVSNVGIVGWLNSTKVLLSQETANGALLSNGRSSGLFTYDFSDRSFSDFLEDQGVNLFEATSDISILPNGKGFIYPTGYYEDFSVKSYRLHILGSGDNRSWGSFESFDENSPIGVTTVELLSQESTKVGFSYGLNTDPLLVGFPGSSEDSDSSQYIFSTRAPSGAFVVRK